MKTKIKPTNKVSEKAPIKLPKKPAPALTHEQLVEARDRLFELKASIETAREEELQIREYLANKLHTGDEGAVTVTIDGVKVAITKVINRTISREEAERFTTEHPELSLECLRWKAEVRVGEYKKHREEMDEYIVTKPGPPTVEFK